jgi:hypothetical protein
MACAVMQDTVVLLRDDRCEDSSNSRSSRSLNKRTLFNSSWECSERKSSKSRNRQNEAIAAMTL